MKNNSTLITITSEKRSYRRVFSLLVFFNLCFLFDANSTVYYISSQGNDSNTGKMQQLSWKTIDKVNTSMSLFVPGDSILLKRGDVFYESLKISKSGSSANPIYFGAYGTGANPILYGGKVLANWTPKGNNIWETVCQDCPLYVEALSINNKLTPKSLITF